MNYNVSCLHDFGFQELTRIALGQIPEHWNLWQHYSTGVILSETGEKSSDVENLKLAASKHSKQMKVNEFYKKARNIR